MTVGELKKLLANVNDDKYISVVDMENFDVDFVLGDDINETYIEIILPVYIEKYTKEE